MDITWFLIGCFGGFFAGRNTAPAKETKNDEKLNAEITRLNTDIAYYKKLTKQLVEENKELRYNNDRK
jgi:hypothetical protein